MGQLNGTNTTSRTISPVDMELIFGAQRDPMYIEVALPISIIYAILLITGLSGNMVICFIIIMGKEMHTPTNYILRSLATSDVLLLISGMPQLLFCRCLEVFGEAFCVIRIFAAETSMHASVLTTLAFSVERYLAICHPLKLHKMSKLSRARMIVLIVWAVALACALPLALQLDVRSYQGVAMYLKLRILISTSIFFFFPFITMMVLYTLMGVKFNMKREKKIHIYLNRSTSTSKSTKPSVKMTVAVVVAFFVCWAPFHAQRLAAVYWMDGGTPTSALALRVYSVLTYISGVLYYASPTINPILYHIMSSTFRNAFKKSLPQCCRREDRSQQRCCYPAPAPKSSEKSGPYASGIKRGSKSSGLDKKITFSTDFKTAHYKHNNGQAELVIIRDIEKDMNDSEERSPVE